MAGALNHTSKVGINGEELLLPEILHDAGYVTGCFGKWHLGTDPRFFPTRNGFDTWSGIPYSNDNGPLHPTIRGIPALPFYRNDKVIETDPDQAQFTKRLTKDALEFIEQNKTRKFFLYLPHVMPHVPIFAARKPSASGERSLYTQVIEELDAGVGEVLAALKRLDLEKNTIVIFMSDNGPFLSYGNHAGRVEPLREGKLTTFEGGVRVPFLIRWPGQIPAGKTNEELITGLDLLPSLVKICGCDLPANKIDGIDLSALLLGEEEAKGRDVFAYYSGSELQAIRRGKWKLHFPHEYLTVNGPPGKDGKPANFASMKPLAIEQSGIRGIASRHGYRVEPISLSLFDLSTDVGETKDVAAENPQVVTELKQLANSFRQDLGDELTKQAGSGLRAAGRVE
jgi:arylsulfatase